MRLVLTLEQRRLFVAVPADRDPQPVRIFGDVYRGSAWLGRLARALRDSFGSYGIDKRVLDSGSSDFGSTRIGGVLGQCPYVKNVPGRKTDVSDCQWIQYLHSVGLLRASFRPPGVICAIRSLWRHRGSLIQMAAEHVLHMQKALESDEPADPSRTERRHRRQRAKDSGCHLIQ